MTPGRRPLSIAALSLLLAGAAQAQDGGTTVNGYHGDIELVRPVWAPENLPGIDVPYGERGGSVRWGLAMGYTNSPLVLYEFDDVEVGSVVQHRTTAFAGVSVDITPAFAVRFSVPVIFQFGTEVPKYSADGFAFGDMALGAHWAFFRRPAVALGLKLDMSLPTARKNYYAGERLPRLNPALLAAFTIGRVRIATDLGANVRFENIDTTEDLQLGTELAWNTGVRVNAIAETLDVGASVYTRFSFQKFGQPGETPVELLANLAYRPIDWLWLNLSGGRGVTRGYGATDARVMFELRFQKVRKAPEELPDPGMLDDGQAAGDGGLQFNVRDVGTLAGGDENAAQEEDEWGELVAKYDQDIQQIRIRYALNFKVGTATLLEESKPTLDAVADILNGDARIGHVVIEGHASREGGYDMNYELSYNRAKAIWEYLLDRGVHPSRISVRGMGEVVPPEETGGMSEAEAARRVVFHVVRQYENWEEPPQYKLDLERPWDGEPYEAVQPRFPGEDVEVPGEVGEPREADTLEDVEFDMEPSDDDMSFEDEADTADTATDEPPAPDDAPLTDGAQEAL